VIKLRIFYVYNINDYFSGVYDNYPYKLYKMLEDAYISKKYNVRVSSSIYEQIITNFNKLFMNNFLFVNNKLDIHYYNKNNFHFISNSAEYSKLMVTSYCIKIKSNINYPSFFENINNYSDNIFVCDFINNDYFWLNKVVKSKNSLVKQ